MSLLTTGLSLPGYNRTRGTPHHMLRTIETFGSNSEIKKSHNQKISEITDETVDLIRMRLDASELNITSDTIEMNQNGIPSEKEMSVSDFTPN